jgi:hypothetical protein
MDAIRFLESTCICFKLKNFFTLQTSCSRHTNADKDFDYRKKDERLTAPNHFFLEEYILRKEEILKDLLVLQGRKCRIQLRGSRFYMFENCRFDNYESSSCKNVLEEFRTFFTNEELPVTFH